MLNYVIAAVAVIALGTPVEAAPVETTPAPIAVVATETVETATEVETVEYVVVPDEDLPLAAGIVSIETVDAVAESLGFAVVDEDQEAVRVYAKRTAECARAVYVYNTHAFVSTSDPSDPETLGAGYAFSLTVEDGVVTCQEGFSLGRALVG